jgi:hypothetical protein
MAARRPPGSHPYETRGSLLMCFTSASRSRPPFRRRSFKVRQRAESESPSQAIERGARCQFGLPGTPLDALFSV